MNGGGRPAKEWVRTRAVWQVAGLILPFLLNAHRLDECLQATFISVEPDHVLFELSLTPGVEVAPAFLAEWDTNGDGIFPTLEQTAGADRVMKNLSASIDARRLDLTLVGIAFPEPVQLKTGLGMIRLTFRAEFPPLTAGGHELSYTNRYRTNLSVYLVNALIPESPRVWVVEQKRDLNQNVLRLGFRLDEISAGQAAPIPRSATPSTAD